MHEDFFNFFFFWIILHTSSLQQTKDLCLSFIEIIRLHLSALKTHYGKVLLLKWQGGGER